MNGEIKSENEESDKEGDFGVKEWRDGGGDKDRAGREVKGRKKENNKGRVAR